MTAETTASGGAATVLIAGGGTAGHVFPALAVAKALKRTRDDLEVAFVGTEERLEGRLVPDAGFPLHHIDALPVPRRLSPGLLRVPAALRRGVAECARLIEETKAVVVASFGGYVGFPLAMAARRTATPLIIHEQNAMPGLANRVAGRWADRIAVTFPSSRDHFARPDRVAVTGNPVREEILAVDPERHHGRALGHFGLTDDRLTVLVFGGSQGARRLNRAAIDSAGRWVDVDRLQILHATGQALYEETTRAWKQAQQGRDGPLVRCLDFIDDMAAAYAAADVVVCRAGATSVAEVTAIGRAAVLVPYPHATKDHQSANAVALERIGAAQLVADADLDGARLVDAVQPWLDDADKRADIAGMARAFGRRDAAGNLVRIVTGQVDAARTGPG